MNSLHRTAAFVVVLIFTIVALILIVSPADGHHIRGCNTASCDKRVKKACWESAPCRTRVIRKQWHKVADPYWGIFNAIAECESGGNWQINTGNGFYGGIQFTSQSWKGVGGSGLPHDATKLEQIYRGVRLMHVQGWGAWPHCRHEAGV